MYCTVASPIKSLPAITAAVWFLSGVNKFMSPELVRSSKCFPTRGAHFGFVPHVRGHMAVKALWAEKALPTGVTNIRLLSGMKSLVIVQVGLGPKFFDAKLTRVWTDVVMYPHMDGEIFLFLELLWA